MRLKDVHAVVTGGGSGIGAAIARALAEEGARLTLIGRRVEPIEAVAATILGAITIPVDVTDRASIDIGFETARTAHGPIGILVNNAGIAPVRPSPG